MNYGSIIYLFLLLCGSTYGKITKSSLTFVIDDTGSMGDDIDQVKYATNLVFDTVLNTNSSQIENFILVTFNDPDLPRVRTITRDKEVFKNTLESIYVDGGYDCPELSLSGIELALKESFPGSYLYVFTDATAKDVHLLDSVQNLAAKKRSQIIFLLTGECSSDWKDPNFQSYYKLAKATNGQVFHIHKQDIEEILNYVAETISHPKTVIGITELPPGYGHNFTIPVDAGIKDVVVSGSGKEPKISTITAPDGSPRDVVHVVDLPGAVVVKVPNTEPGNYTVTGGGKSASTFVTTASTTVDFKYGFLAVEPSSIDDCASLPIADQESRLAIQLITESKDAALITVEILDLDGNVLAEMPLKMINRKQKLYTTDLFVPPNSLFKIAVKGHMKDSKSDKSDFKRVSATAIEPQKPTLVKPEDRAPTVKYAEKLIRVLYDQPLKIPCKVNGYPKPDTIWLDKNGKILPSEDYVIESPYDYLSVFELKHVKENGAYTCKATNSFGESSMVVNVEVEKQIPKIDKTTLVVHKKKGDEAEITCRILKGKPDPKIFWYFLPQNSQEYEKLEGSEVIALKNVEITQAGVYRCVAINEMGHDDHITNLVVEYPPTVRSGKTYIRSIEGKPTSLSCYARGVPKPHVNWFLDGVQIVSDRKHHIYRDNSLRFLGSLDNRGAFTCVATNPHGSANKTVLVDYVAPVTIQPPEQSTFTLKVGDNVDLPCHADGYPQPSIKWLFYREDRNDSSVLRIVEITYSAVRTKWICVASNRETSANMTYHVKINAPPEIERIMDKTFSAVLGDLVLRIPCKATGNPKPDITWTKDGLNIASGTEWYEIKGDGSLFIKNVDGKSGGTYVCHAENFLGDDKELFSVIVKPYPDEKATSKTITLEEGSSENIECDIPHTRVDSLRWFKDRRLLYVGELTLRNVQLSNSGIYTCRVSTDSNSQSKSVKVEVGSKPYFVSDVSSVINFEEDIPAFLDCTAFGEPVPEVTWYHEDEKTEFNDMVYDIIMAFDNRGKYFCVVSNSFGSIRRDFEIVSKDCVLSASKDFAKNQPLMLDISRRLPSFENVDGFLRIPFGENFLLFCPGGFAHIAQTEITATCEKEKSFRVGRNLYDYSELICQDEMEITTLKTGRFCRTANSEEVKVGYMAGGKFVEVYEVCIDKEKNAPVHAKHRIRRSLSDTEPDVTKWQTDDSVPLNVDEIYNCDVQVNGISSTLRKWFHKIPVDAGIKDVVVSGSGKEPKISTITAPDGSPRDVVHVVDLPGAVVVKVPNTEPGNYTVTGGGKSASTFVTTASTTVDFKYGFLAVEPSSIDDCASLPIADQESRLAIQLITESKDAALITVEILDLDGNVLAEMPLKMINRKQKLYTTDLFVPPNSLFKIAVKGHMKDSKSDKSDFKRVSATAIEPQKPTLVKPEDRAPTVKYAEKLIRVLYDQPLKIPCKVNGYPKPDTIWLDKNGKILPSEDYVIESPYDYLSVFELKHVKENGAYTCKATNSFGESSMVVNVEVEKQIPKIDKTTLVVHKKKGDEAEITCRILKGKPDPKIFWYFLPQNSQEYEKLEGSEVIALKNVEITQAGVYRCVAINEMGHDDHITNLVVEYPPTVRSGKTYIRSIEGKPTSLSCYARGVPKPHVNWFLDGVQIVSDRKHHIYRDNSLRFLGSLDNRGAFTCVATNPHGSANKTVLVDYVAPVTIQPPEQSTFTLKVGDNVDLPCHADGYPQPSIKWLFYREDRNDSSVLRPNHVSGSLKLRILQLEQNGHRETSANMTYHVKINAPPEIERIMDKTFSAVLGDLVLRIPCKATGNPKPDITWTKDGLNIASGTEWYEIKGDGSLFIKNVDGKSGGTYVCHAENFLGDDKELFSVIVKPYPDEKATSKTITLEEGSSENIECDIPHTRVDSLRWFKDRRLLYVGELTLRNVQLSNSGIYTCRVSTDSNSQSKSVKVEVGSKPYFVSDVSSVINFEEDIPAFLDCTAFGEPVPEVTWYHEDEKTEFNDMVYDIIMAFDNRGKYFCVVSNSFGSIRRDFEIVSKDCVLSASKDFAKNQPLMLDISRRLPSFENVDGFLRIPFGENFLLFCPGGFAHIAQTEITATCEKEKSFRVGRNLYDYSELICQDEMEITTLKTGRFCRTANSEEVKVGYMAGGKFVEVYEVCIDKEKNAPVHAKHRIRRSLSDTEPDVTKWQTDDSVPLNVDEIYNCDVQVNGISSTLRKWFHKVDKCCFKKRQLINTRDLPVGLPQKAAFSYLNVVPHWSTCNSKNWDIIEEKVRDLVKSSYEDLLVWTGTTGSLKLENSAGVLINIALEDSRYLQQEVPRYLWKVVQSPESESSLAIVQLNIPDLTASEAYRHMVCTDICQDVPWLKGHYWRSPAEGYTFCCNLDQFEEAFGFEGRFGVGNRNVFYGPSALSTRAL